MDRVFRKSLLLIVIISLFTACSEDEPAPFPEEGYTYNVDSISDIAKALVNLRPDIDICREVHSATQKSIFLGLDESYYFVEMLGKGERITKTSEHQRLLLSKLESLPDTNNIRQLFERVSTKEDCLQTYQIYWPYSERWDGIELPTITFKSKESPLVAQDSNVGYVYIEGKLEEVLVNEEYAKLHPVWIINTNPIPYDEYPDFAERNWTMSIFPHHEYFKQNKEWNIPRHILYIKGKTEKEVSSITRPDYADYNDIDFNCDTLSLFLKEVSFNKKTSNLHSLFSGGAHYIFNIETVDIEDINPADYNTLQTWRDIHKVKSEYIGVRFVYLRSEMNKKEGKIFDQLLSWRWLPFESNIPLTILHEFGGKSIDFPYYRTGTSYEIWYNFVRKQGAKPDGGAKMNEFVVFNSGYIPLKLNDELLQFGECYRDEYNYYELSMWIDYDPNSLFYDVIRKTENINCTLDVIKGMSIPSWYTPTVK